MIAVAPVLVLAVGNPSRGDDALGPALAERIESARLPGVEVITDFQLQIEHSLDLVGRERVIFVDAGTGTISPFEFRRLRPAAEFLHTSHALSPEAVLATYSRVRGAAPPESWMMCVRGERFELGEGLSPDAADHLEAAWPALRLALTRPGPKSRIGFPVLRPPADCAAVRNPGIP